MAYVHPSDLGAMERVLKAFTDEGLNAILGEEVGRAKKCFANVRAPYIEYTKLAQALDERVLQARTRTKDVVSKAIALDQWSSPGGDALSAFEALQMDALGTHGLIIATVNELHSIHSETHERLQRDFGFVCESPTPKQQEPDQQERQGGSDDPLSGDGAAETTAVGPRHLHDIIKSLSSFQNTMTHRATMGECIRKLQEVVAALQLARGLEDCDVEGLCNYMKHRTLMLKERGIQSVHNLEGSVEDLEKTVRRWESSL